MFCYILSQFLSKTVRSFFEQPHNSKFWTLNEEQKEVFQFYRVYVLKSSPGAGDPSGDFTTVPSNG